jgi:hypothetical protein
VPIVLFICVALVIGGGFLVARGVRGGISLSEPHCAKCGYDLRGHLLQQQQVQMCPECGSDITRPGAVHFGRAGKRPPLIVAGIVVLILPALLMLLFSVQTVRTAVVASPGPFGNATKTNAVLLADLKKTADQPWTWQELEARFKTNRLSNAEVAIAVDELIASINKTRTRDGYAGPLHWSNTFLRATSTAIATTQQSRLYQAYYGPAPVIAARSKIRAGMPLMFDLRWGGPWNLEGVKFVCALRDVKSADGTKLPIAPRYTYDRMDDPDGFTGDGNQHIGGRILNLSEGEHDLVFNLDAGVIAQDAPMTGVNNKPGQKQRWVKPLDTWQASVKFHVTVIPASQPIVALVEDEAQNPATDPTFTAPRLIVKRQMRSGVTIDISWKNLRGSPPVPICTKAILRLPDGTEHPIGGYAVWGNASSMSTSINLKSLAPEVTSVDIILRPDRESAENYPDIDRIWGKPILFEHVPLERYDLPTTAPTSP